MESVLSRYRNLIILVGVLFLQVLGLAMQVKRGTSTTEEKDTRLIRIWAVGAISPFERGLVWLQNGTSNIWHNYFYLRGVRAENRQLKEQIEQMRLNAKAGDNQQKAQLTQQKMMESAQEHQATMGEKAMDMRVEAQKAETQQQDAIAKRQQQAEMAQDRRAAQQFNMMNPPAPRRPGGL